MINQCNLTLVLAAGRLGVYPSGNLSVQKETTIKFNNRLIIVIKVK